MALTYQLIVLLGLSSGLWMGADADCPAGCCVVCPEGWIAHNSRCFQFFNELKDWSEAEDACVAKGGNLASVHNDELDFVRKLVRQSAGGPTRTWLGGYDAVKEGAWKWSNGDKFDFNGWTNGEPNNQKGPEDCMELMHTAAQIFNDAPCDVKKAFLCVRDPVVVKKAQKHNIFSDPDGNPFTEAPGDIPV
ncbi:galactose-specific lectin nattectin-like [Halichoeres trimaculatus]|uniref:galactose-specific lectin nattectin-like n=1 Tax=Halichoeres trimaculatus TaxID=147232 RepID=UPI003D9EB5ED